MTFEIYEHGLSSIGKLHFRSMRQRGEEWAIALWTLGFCLILCGISLFGIGDSKRGVELVEVDYQAQGIDVFSHYATHAIYGDVGHLVLRDSGESSSQVTLSILDKMTETLLDDKDETDYSQFGNVPRKQEGGSKYSRDVSSGPRHITITGHSEASYLRSSPRHVIFSCLEPAREGGRTPLHDLDIVLDTLTKLAPWLVEELQAVGVEYFKNYPLENTYRANLWEFRGVEVYRSWAHLFPDLNHTDIDEFFDSQNMTSTWQDDGSLTVSWKQSAFALHPDSQKLVFFNQLFAMNGRYWEAHGGFEKIPLVERPMHTRLGNGREITDYEYEALEQSFEAARVSFEWQKNDILLVDNFRFAHSRDPYEGHRKCVVLNGEPIPVPQVPA